MKKNNPLLWIIGIIVVLIYITSNNNLVQSVGYASTDSSCDTARQNKIDSGQKACSKCFEIDDTFINCAKTTANTDYSSRKGTWGYFLDATDCGNLQANTRIIISQCLRTANVCCEIDGDFRSTPISQCPNSDIYDASFCPEFSCSSDEDCKRSGTICANKKCIEGTECSDFILEHSCLNSGYCIANIKDDVCMKSIPLTIKEFTDVISNEDRSAMWGSYCFNINQCDSKDGYSITCKRDSRVRTLLEQGGFIEAIRDVLEWLIDEDKPTAYCSAYNEDKGECSRNSDCDSGEVCADKECVEACDNFWEDPSNDCSTHKYIIYGGIGFLVLIAFSFIRP